MNLEMFFSKRNGERYVVSAYDNKLNVYAGTNTHNGILLKQLDKPLFEVMELFGLLPTDLKAVEKLTHTGQDGPYQDSYTTYQLYLKNDDYKNLIYANHSITPSKGTFPDGNYNFSSSPISYVDPWSKLKEKADTLFANASADFRLDWIEQAKKNYQPSMDELRINSKIEKEIIEMLQVHKVFNCTYTSPFCD